MEAVDIKLVFVDPVDQPFFDCRANAVDVVANDFDDEARDGVGREKQN